MAERNTGNQEALRRIERAGQSGGTRLDLSAIGLDRIPDAIAQLPLLQHLDLSRNAITTIPELIGDLSQLQTLDIHNNRISGIPTWIGKLTNLRRLGIWTNRIKKVPDSIAQLSALRDLNLGGNQLGCIPEAVTRLTNLRLLYLWENHISTVPESITRLSYLHELYLGRNSIDAIPEFICQMTRLRALHLWSNHINTIPERIASLRELRTLDITDNQIEVVTEAVAELTKLQDLKLGQNRLSTLPPVIAHLSQLQTLRLEKNLLRSVPDDIAQLSELRELDLSNNQLAILPHSIGKPKRLRRVNLAHNQLTGVPESLGELSELEELDLTSNRVTDITHSITRLSNLRSLRLSNNQIAAIPDSIGRLSKLEVLLLDQNKITLVSESIGQLNELTTLDLSDNRLSRLPAQLSQLTKLFTLFLHGNPGLGIPVEVLGPLRREVSPLKPEKPPQDILNYLARMEDSRALNEAKLILVGQGAVGKSSLVKALITGKFKKGEKSTEGIRIRDWHCLLTKKETVIVHVWDFGGQEMMHATHQFFLTQRSLYLLVLNRRTGGVDREADYWFRLIRAFGGKEAPVIVVLNKQESEPFDVNREGWLEKYRPNIKAFVATDCENQTTITQLKRKIVEQLATMASLKVRFPRGWFAIKDVLSQMSKEHISFDEYRRLCQEHGESDPASQTSLAGFLHDLGIALNYRQDPRLSFNYVLKPEWVTQGIYALLHAFVRQRGVFTHSEAETELARRKYSADDTNFLLGLMERFELCFALGDRQNRVLIPELLADQQPRVASEFSPERCLNFGYKYPVLPEGLLPRFIARTHHLGKPEARWKSGVILEDDATACRALVRADAPDAEIRVHIAGPEDARRELLGIIRYNFDVIHSDYEFKPDALVYPPDAPQKAVSLDELKALVQNNETTVPVVLPDRSVIKQAIATLIEPVAAVPSPLKLFLSYSHADEKSINELRKDLRLMEMNGLIRPWHDRAILAGEQWEASLLNELNTADFIVCQLSRDYLFSDYCRKELQAAIERKRRGEAEMIAYLLTDCGWKEFPGLSDFQVLPTDAKPLADWPDPNKYWRAVISGIQQAIKKRQSERKDKAAKEGASGRDLQ